MEIFIFLFVKFLENHDPKTETEAPKENDEPKQPDDKPLDYMDEVEKKLKELFKDEALMPIYTILERPNINSEGFFALLNKLISWTKILEIIIFRGKRLHNEAANPRAKFGRRREEKAAGITFFFNFKNKNFTGRTGLGLLRIGKNW